LHAAVLENIAERTRKQKINKIKKEAMVSQAFKQL
jgi:hypothetical protein